MNKIEFIWRDRVKSIEVQNNELIIDGKRYFFVAKSIPDLLFIASDICKKDPRLNRRAS